MLQRGKCSGVLVQAHILVHTCLNADSVWVYFIICTTSSERYFVLQNFVNVIIHLKKAI